MIRLNKKQILLANIKWREGLIPLSYSKHAKQRLEERVEGELIVAPTIVRITKDNLYNGGTFNQKRLIEACIKLDYKYNKWMFLAINIGTGTVKSIWIDDKYKKRVKPEAEELREKVGDVQENMEQQTTHKPTFWEKIIWRAQKLLYGSYFRAF